MAGNGGQKKPTDRERYEAAGHAVLSGIGFDKSNKDREPKHLRHGVNMAMCDHAALVRLLVKKGMFSNEEYMKELVDEVEREVERYKARLTEQYGVEINLL